MWFCPFTVQWNAAVFQPEVCLILSVSLYNLFFFSILPSLFSQQSHFITFASALLLLSMLFTLLFHTLSWYALFLFVLSSPPDLILEMHFYKEVRILSLISSSEHKTQLLVYFQNFVNMITYPQLSYSFTGYPFVKGFISKYFCSHGNPCIDLHHLTYFLRRMCQHGLWDRQINFFFQRSSDKLLLSTHRHTSHTHPTHNHTHKNVFLVWW